MANRKDDPEGRILMRPYTLWSLKRMPWSPQIHEFVFIRFLAVLPSLQKKNVLAPQLPLNNYQCSPVPFPEDK